MIGKRGNLSCGDELKEVERDEKKVIFCGSSR